MFFFVILSRTHASGERVLYETLHTRLGMENLDIEEVCDFGHHSNSTVQIHSFYRTFFSPLQVLVYLQVRKNISMVFLGDWQEVTSHVCAVTKAISKRPSRSGPLWRDELNVHQMLPVSIFFLPADC